MTLAAVVSWAAILSVIVGVIIAVLNRRDIGRERNRQHAGEVQTAYDRGRQSMLDELSQVRADRDYWRDIVVRRTERSSHGDTD